MKKLAKQQALEELQTLRDLVRWSVSQMQQANLHFGHGTNNAWDEAVWLAVHVIHLPFEYLEQSLDARLTKKEREAIVDLVEQRITKRIPAAYITHQAWFAGLPYYVDERVIVPRSPVAELIEREFTPWCEPSKVHHILDLCTGSGCIAIACAHAFPDAEIDATDLSKEALAVATINCKQHQVSDQVNLIQSDLFKAVPSKKYDLIVSNPPYINVAEYQQLPEEYKHEPSLGLKAGDDGLACVNRIINQSEKYLSDHGVLVVEVGSSAEVLINAYPALTFTWIQFERGGDGVFLLTAKQLRS